MAKRKASRTKSNRSKAKRRTANALQILDKRFGVGAQRLNEKFRADADVAEMLYAARKEAGLSQTQLAKTAGTTQQVISQLEDADYEGHSLSMLRRIATALNSHVEVRLVSNSSGKVAN